MRLLALLLLLLLAPAGLAHAQTGKLTGTVTEVGTGEPLIGVNVSLEGTTVGAITDIDGEYTIIGIRPGTYTLVASYVGFNTVRVEDVRIRIDLTTTVDFELGEQVIEGEEVIVTAERPLVQRDLTATTSVVGGEEIRAAPVDNLQDVVNLQAGVVNGHFRGGRLGEVGYWVDGLPVTDVFNGGLGVAVENTSVEELQVVTGAFNAEYGQALSGIVNVVTRDGSNEFSGSVSAFTGDYLSADDDLFLGIDDVSPVAVRNVEGNLSGPVVRDRLWFFVSGRYFGNDGYLQGQRVFSIEPFEMGDSSLVDFNPYERRSGQAKLTWRALNSTLLTANVFASEDEGRSSPYELLLQPDSRPFNQSTSRNGYVKLTQTFSNTTFLDLGITNTYTTFRERLFDDPLDERYLSEEILGQNNSAFSAGFRAVGTSNGRFERSTNTWLVKADLTSQVNDLNLVKTGIEFRQHELSFLDQTSTIDLETGVRAIRTNGEYTYRPIEAAAYVQDKIEWGSLVVNVGLRFDYFDSRGEVLRDLTDPDALFIRSRAELTGQDPNAPTDYTPDAFFEDAEAKWQFSPRLGVAFPITEGGVVHFSYGQFFQTPQFALLYQNPFFQLGSGGSGLVGLLGNANLEPEQTISGEIGLKQQIGATSAVELTAYYRDIRNLTGTAADPIQIEGTSARYGRLLNSDFGFVRGLVARFDQRVGQGLYASVDYTFQVARANSSDPAQAFNAAAARGEIETQIVPTSWDQRHTANVSVNYDAQGQWGFGLIGSIGSGQPFTPAQNTAQTGQIIPGRIPLNSEVRPVVYNIDLNVFRNLTLGGFNAQIFARADNLFDVRTEYGVFGDTGRATYSLQQNIDERTFIGNPELLQRWYQRPYFFGEPRRVVLGLQVSF
jgi:outer membrane receptor protein involved in Fe transport